MYRTLVVKNRFPSRLATDEGEKMFMQFLHVGIGGGVLAFVGGIIAQVDPNGQGNTGYWVAASGIATALAAGLGTIAKAFFEDREKSRQDDILRLRITLGNDRLRHYHVETREYLEKVADYLAKIPGAPPGIPRPPARPDPISHDDLKLEPDDD